MNISTCISNVPGPDFPLYCAGAKMVDYYGLGVLTPGMGIFHLAFSYFGKITLSVLADRNIMPDPEFYHDCLVDSYEELYAAATRLGSDVPRNADVAAKAKIQSPRRERALAQGKMQSVPKHHAAKASRVAAATRRAKGTSQAKNKAKATTKPPARKRAAGVAAERATRAAEVAKRTTRPKVVRRASSATKPKLQ